MASTDPIQTSLYFQTPIFHIEIPEWVDKIDKVCDKYIKEAKKNNQKIIEDRENNFNKKELGDIGMCYQSNSLINDPELKELQEYIGKTSLDVLDYMGYEVSEYVLFLTEFWVQHFAEKGAGHHEGHIHYDNHISGFYFLRCSEKTSVPVFHDPRQAKLMNDLPRKNENEVSMASPTIHYKPKPGTMIFTPAYLEHQFTVDPGVDDFRFIHFNLQAIRKMIINTIKSGQE
jgi:uncharacterized protein (TIGR02466 family)